METKDYYEILELSQEDKKLTGDAFNKKLKSNFRKLSKKYHPDSQHGKTEEEKKKSEELFKQINEANSVLSDKDKRNLYNQYGKGLGREVNGGQTEEDIREVIRQMHEDMYSSFGGQNRNVKTVTVNLTLNEMYNGLKKTIKYNTRKVCEVCDGLKYNAKEGGSKTTCTNCNGVGQVHSRHGNMIMTQTCGVCGGQGYIIKNGCKNCNATGFVNEEKSIEIQIPKGVFNGAQVSFKGMGDAYMTNNGVAVTDLILIVNQIRDSKFERNGNDLLCELEIPIIDCILGESVSVESITKKAHKFKLNTGTSNGQKYRLGGLGMPIMNSNNFGDLYVYIKHKMPKELTEEERNILVKFKNINNGK